MNKDICKNPKCGKVFKSGEGRLVISGSECVCLACEKSGYMKKEIQEGQKVWRELFS